MKWKPTTVTDKCAKVYEDVRY